MALRVSFGTKHAATPFQQRLDVRGYPLVDPEIYSVRAGCQPLSKTVNEHWLQYA
jgi:hypothetical protein